MTKLTWNPTKTSEKINTAMRALAVEYPLAETSSAKPSVTFKETAGEKRSCRISQEKNAFTIEYTDTAAALRALGGILGKTGTTAEETSFSSFGIMLDCSRNAVMTVEHLKGWLRKLSLLGYNMAMLYTEDTYQLPGEPYFGYQRGAYSAAELREIDAYASSLGIELIPCIQTLGHLAQILQWAAYEEVRDTGQVLLVDEEKTYILIEKMIKHFAENVKSRRIHIGMDETHDLGRGRFMDRVGYERGFDIFNRHLAKVNSLCEKYGLKPMIWSDMYFRMGSKDMNYYDKECIIPDDVKAKIPKNVELVYWDYYHDTEDFYSDWIKRHRDLGFEPIMGSGVWTWAVLWYGREITEMTAGPCIRASLKAGLKEIFFTMWGDDGAYCEFDSAMAGLAWTAELAYTGDVSHDTLSSRFAAVCHADYDEILAPSDFHIYPESFSSDFLWDDPILRIVWHNFQLKDANFWTKASERYNNIVAKTTKPKTKSTAAGDLAYANILARYLAKKIEINQKLDRLSPAYDRTLLESFSAEIKAISGLIDKLDAAFRKQWLRRNKPNGLEVIQIRLAAQKRRYQELAERIRELLADKISKIDELENLPTEPLKGVSNCFHFVSTASAIL
jgi:hexosaminidase